MTYKKPLFCFYIYIYINISYIPVFFNHNKATLVSTVWILLGGSDIPDPMTPLGGCCSTATPCGVNEGAKNDLVCCDWNLSNRKKKSNWLFRAYIKGMIHTTQLCGEYHKKKHPFLKSQHFMESIWPFFFFVVAHVTFRAPTLIQQCSRFVFPIEKT